MSTRLLIGHTQNNQPFNLPADAVTQTFACLAKRGGGKTYAASVLAEEMIAAGFPIVVIDPIGVWWGLRANGSGKGLPVLILGGEHKDIPLDPSAGHFVAEFVVSEHVPIILDVSEFGEGQMRRFVADFLQTFYHRNRDPVHLFIDEADEFAPQGNFGPDSTRSLGAMQNVIRRGRARGIGATLITQRSAALSKSVLTQTEALLAFQTTGPQDLTAIDAWIQYHGTREERDQIMSDLTRLPRGSCWFYSPGWMKRLERVTIRQRQTFDSSKTPEPGKAAPRPKGVADVDLSRLGDRMKQAIADAKAGDPAELKKQIADLKRQLTAAQTVKPAATIDQAAIDRTVQKALAARDRRDFTIRRKLESLSGAIAAGERAWADLRKHVDGITSDLATPAPDQVPTTAAVETRPTIPPVKTVRPSPVSTPMNGDGQIGKGGLRRMLIALAQRPAGLSARQLGVRAGLSSKSGTFDTYLSRGRQAQWLSGDRSRMAITEEGLAALGDYEPLPTGHALLEHWLGDLGDSGAARMLRALASAYPQALTRQQLGEAAGLSASSGTFDTYLSRLRSLELVEGKGELKAAKELFD